MANTRRRTQRPTRTNTRMAARNAGPNATTLDANNLHTGDLGNWDSEMKYIRKDLRDLTLVSVFLFALLFIVGFFL